MKNMMILIIAAITLTACPDIRADDAPSPVAAEIPSAADALEKMLAESDKLLYVYKDFVDGGNNFTQKAWIGDSLSDVPAMDEAAAGRLGTTGISAELDFRNHSWGGYMFVNGVLSAGETEPKLDFGARDAGLDLTGASKLTFYAKGEKGGERVEFFMGGLGRDVCAAFADSTAKVSTGYVTLTREWTRFEIPLDGKDLSRVGCGFGWVTDSVRNPGAASARFSVDEIRYEFAQSRVFPRNLSASGQILPVFPRSYAPAPPGTDAAVINNFAYLYDGAAAAMALSYAGKPERARQIADAIVYALRNDRFFGDGRLRNAYSGGDPRSFPGWLSGKGGAFARLPGFYSASDKTWDEDYYAVSTSTGNVAWAIMALCEVYENAGRDEDYLRAAAEAGDFVLTLFDNRGGFTGGYEGWEGGQTRVTYKSTEHNIDLITAFGRLGKLTGERKYADASGQAKAFVLSMFDKTRGCFYTGTTDDGVTISRDVLPLDCCTWALLALGDSLTAADRAAALRFIETNMAVDGGFDFNTDRDGVWNEGTAQAALAYKICGQSGKYAELLAYLNANRLPDGAITAADRDGVTTGFTVSGTDLPWLYNKREHVGATAWLAFAQMERNPFAY
ncbi:MAG: terpene cyclase/mutase family protein [Clostridiales bacterium]|jgi:hypothetical protein|nr:terpene cyclase/mutase family protein [Clostridiales bacterium]